MKFIICTLLLSAIAGIKCFPGPPDYKYSYGIGGRAGVTYNGSREFGIHAKNGTYSVFTNGFVDPSIHGDGGVFINPANPAGAAKPILPLPSEASNNPFSQPPQGRMQYPFNIPAPAYNPYPLLPPYGQNYGVPIYNPYNPQGVPAYGPNNAGQMYNPYAAQGLPLYRPDYAAPMYNPYQAQAGAQNGQLYGVPQQVEAGGMEPQTTQNPTE